MAQDVFQVHRVQHDLKHEELQRLQQDALLQCVCIQIRCFSYSLDGLYKTRIGTHRHVGTFFYADRIQDFNL